MISLLVWKATGDSFTGVTLKGELVFGHKKAVSLFQLRLEAWQKKRRFFLSAGFWR